MNEVTIKKHEVFILWQVYYM